jgi:SAM-dependent methyltransferase
VKRRVKRLLRPALPVVFLVAAIYPWRWRWAALAGLVAVWAAIYARYRRTGLRRMRRERELMERVTPDAFSRHYNERVPTIEEEFEIWGPYHQHRHEMRYSLVAEAVRANLPAGGRMLDVGCGAALVADLLSEVEGHYVGMDYGGPHIAFAASKPAPGALRRSFVRSDAEALPLASSSVDVVLMSEVIEHLLHPEWAVWEIARVLRPNGVFVMTTNNASEAPLRSPLTDPISWLEKGLGAGRPSLISHRPWIWPERIDPELLPPGSPDTYVPHTHHIYAETSALFAAAGLDCIRWSTFEFPPPQSSSASLLARMGATGRRAADAIEAVATRTPLLRRLGTHLFVVARKARDPVAARPPAGIWPGMLEPSSGAR